jgi:hypothetical protein
VGIFRGFFYEVSNRCCIFAVNLRTKNVMATIYLTLSAKSDTNLQKEIRIRFKHGKIDQQAKTNIFIPVEYWDEAAQQIIIPNFRLMNDEKKELKQYLTDQSEKLNTLTTTIQTIFNETDKDGITPEWLKIAIDKYNFPEKYAPKVEEKITTLFPFIERFLKELPNPKRQRNRLIHYKQYNKAV